MLMRMLSTSLTTTGTTNNSSLYYVFGNQVKRNGCHSSETVSLLSPKKFNFAYRQFGCIELIEL